MVIFENLKALTDLQKIALALWCADRAFIVLDALTLVGEERDRLETIDGTVQSLWRGPGSTWYERNLPDLAQECENYTADSVKWNNRDDLILSQIFPEPKRLNHDNTINAVTDAVGIAWSLSSLIPRPQNRDFIQLLEVYYDIFFQPTWNYLTGDMTRVSPDESRAILKIVDRNDPLKPLWKNWRNKLFC